MDRRPDVVVFDVNETLSDMAPLRDRFVAAGAPPGMLDAWFAATLRDGFALTLTGAPTSFPMVARDVLRTMLTGTADDVEAATEDVLAGFAELELHPDIAPGIRALHAAGLRLVTLTNGSAEMASRLLSAADLDGLVEARLSVDDAGAWKPAAVAYRYAAAHCGVPVEATMMVAVHPWDLHGAKRAGMTTAYIDRHGSPYPRSLDAPDLRGPP